MAESEIRGDLSELSRQCEELRSLALEAGNIPESILEELHALIDNLGEEITLDGDMTAGGTGVIVIKVNLREGGRFDRCMSALRAFRDGQ